MTSPDSNAIQKWLVDYVATELEVDPDEIPVDEHLVDLGLSSLQAVTMTTGLEEFVHRAIDPGLIWEYPTISTLAEHLASTE